MFVLASALALFMSGVQAQPAASTSHAATHATEAREKVVCKRFSETGSLVRTYKTCKTNAEWQRERDNIRQNQGVSNSCRMLANGGAC